MEKLKTEFLKLQPYVQAVILLVYGIFMFGLMVPSLLSAKSTFAVYIGAALVFASVYYMWSFSEKLRGLLK